MITGKLVLFAPCTELVSKTTKIDMVAPPAWRGVFFPKCWWYNCLGVACAFQKSRWLYVSSYFMHPQKRGVCMNQCEGSSSSEAESHSPQGRASTDQHWKR